MWPKDVSKMVWGIILIICLVLSVTSAMALPKKTVYEKAVGLYGQGGVLSEEIKQRIDYELNIICKKGFDTYFLMVADVVEGAHKIGAITNTRGSAAGSIVGRILGITNVDPIIALGAAS